jgi:sulfonate transport system ATP-binding protein
MNMSLPASTPTGLSVSVRGLVRRFGKRNVIDRLDLDIRRGEFVALLGASGCGKSTLLRILADLDHDIEGDVFVSPRRGVAFQSPRLFPWKRVWSNVIAGLPRGADRASANAALEEVGLTHRGDAWPKDLSGGEAQRASLARALVRNPDLLLLDEPFGALDALTRLKAQALVADLWQKHRQAVLLVTHDVDEALLLADRVLVMRDGVLAHEVVVDLPRPRSAGDANVNRLRVQLLDWLGVIEPALKSTSEQSMTVRK